MKRNNVAFFIRLSVFAHPPFWMFWLTDKENGVHLEEHVRRRWVIILFALIKHHLCNYTSGLGEGRARMKSNLLTRDSAI